MSISGEQHEKTALQHHLVIPVPGLAKTWNCCFEPNPIPIRDKVLKTDSDPVKRILIRSNGFWFRFWSGSKTDSDSQTDSDSDSLRIPIRKRILIPIRWNWTTPEVKLLELSYEDNRTVLLFCFKFGVISPELSWTYISGQEHFQLKPWSVGNKNCIALQIIYRFCGLKSTSTHRN